MFKRIVTFLFSFSLLLFLIRLALPQYIKYVLFLSVALFGILVLFNFYSSKQWYNFSFRLYKTFFPPAIALLAYLFSIAFTSYRSDTLVKDAFNLLVMAIFLFAAIFSDFTSQELISSIKRFRIQVVTFSTLFALAGILKLYLLLKGHKLGFLEVEGLGYPQGTSLSVDDNFFTLVCVVGIIFTSFYLFTTQKLWQSILLQLSLIVLLVNIMLATSRRGLIIAALIIISYLLVWLVSWFTNGESIQRFRKNSVVFLAGIALTIFLFGYFIFGVSTLKRNKWLANSGFNKSETVVYLNWLTMAGESIFRGEVSYDDVQKQNWRTQFDSRYPYTGWAAGNYELVSDLKSYGLQDLPGDAKGARIGAGDHLGFWDGNAYYYSKLFEGSVANGKRYLATLYCYISPDFDGSWVRLSTSGNIKGIRNWYYDLNRKGTWQKLQTTIFADSGDYKAYLYICKEKDSTFENLNGYAIYAYPELKEITVNPADPLTWAINQFEPIQQLPEGNRKILPDSITALRPDKNSIWYRERDSLWLFSAGIYRYNSKAGIRTNPSIYAYVSPDFEGDEVSLYAGGKIFGHTKHKYDLTKKGTWQKLYLSFTIFEGSAWVNYGYRKKVISPTDSIKGYVLFAYPEEKILKFDPNNPITWTGSNFNRVYPLTGDNVEIVPNQSVGLKVDRGTQARVSKNLVYNVNPIWKVKFKKANERVKTSIYAYVSKGFNGEKVRLGGSSKKLGGYNALYYDLSRKGTWQKLTINNWGVTGEEYYSTTYLELPNAKDFKNLEGYVIFAHPDFKVLIYDPKNPDSYTSSTYIREYPLVGENSGIVPTGAAGARYDRTTEGRQWRDLFHSTTEYWSLDVDAGDSVFASVYCYVSPDFNGSEARLELRGKVSGQTVSRYNLDVKGKWVLLQARGVSTEKGRVSGVYFFSQKGVTDFNNLKGYVTFAYPQLVVKQNKKITLLEINNLQYNASFLPLTRSHSVPDTVSDDFKPQMANDRFAGPRIDRWRYAIYLYAKEYSPMQKLIGGGFDYTYKFARKFHPEDPKRDFDYPHNPFLSVLLYSGILGLLVYLWFFVKSLYLYYIYRREYWILGITYLIAFFYSFFSSNSPFEPAFFGLMGALPYLIHYSKKSDELRNKFIF